MPAPVETSAPWSLLGLLQRSEFFPQPYVQLASVLRTAGEPETADRIVFAQREQERYLACGYTDAEDWSISCISQSALKAVIGYGFRMWLVPIWVGMFVFMGAFVFQLARNKEVRQRRRMQVDSRRDLFGLRES